MEPDELRQSRGFPNSIHLPVTNYNSYRSKEHRMYNFDILPTLERHS